VQAAFADDVHLSTWFGDETKRRWAVELLNLVFRQHCWDRSPVRGQWLLALSIGHAGQSVRIAFLGTCQSAVQSNCRQVVSRHASDMRVSPRLIPPASTAVSNA